MRAVIQRVTEASVEVDGETVGRIGPGLLVLVGFARDDTEQDMDRIIDKIIHLRIFEKESGRFDRSLLDIDGGLLVVSQFTLYGDCSKGRRPSFTEAMDVASAKPFFDRFLEKARLTIPRLESGVFQASMKLALVNDGPVTLTIDSRE
jgi:D-aminoacyl-tRNA deacylase